MSATITKTELKHGAPYFVQSKDRNNDVISLYFVYNAFDRRTCSSNPGLGGPAISTSILAGGCCYSVDRPLRTPTLLI